MPYAQGERWALHHGDAVTVLASMPSESVACVVTSPPYWGLRDYGTGRWEGGDETCQHRVGGHVEDNKAPGAITTGQRPGVDASRCLACGARRIDAQIGLEPTPDAYVAALVAVFREVRRVLADDGTLWLNLGDSYAGSGKGAWDRTDVQKEVYVPPPDGPAASIPKVPSGLKPKDLVGIPWRVAFALQADGWWLRSDIIWSKANPMPESVTDRPTKAHEYLFLLAKSQRYYYDADAVAEEAQDWSLGGPGVGILPTTHYHPDNGGNEGLAALAGKYKNGEAKATRNRRSVWTITTEPYPGAHFAVMPTRLVEPCVRAGCPQGGRVLDPFVGSGTVGEVALKENCCFTGIDLNEKYLDMAARRLRIAEEDTLLPFRAAAT